MLRKFTKKRLLLTGIAVLVAATAAFAYWTTSGGGSGSATAGTDAGVTISGDPAAGLYPGGSKAVTTTISNSSSTQAQYVSNLHVSVGVTKAANVSGTCDASWFTYKADSDPATGTGANPASNPHTTGVNTEIAAGGNTTVAGHVYMSDEAATNQDACKGATVTLTYSADNSAS